MSKASRYIIAFTILVGLHLPYIFAQERAIISEINFSKYHSYIEVESALKALADRYSNLARVYSIGKSFAGKELWLIEITNTKTKAAKEKPAVFVCGGLSGEDLAGIEVCLYTAAYILENYGKNGKVKDLVDTKTFYIFPCANPDATEVTRAMPYAQQNNLRPLDNDKDEKIDEDGPDDIDNDGYILQMRVKDPKGEWVIDETDKRLMRKIDSKKGEKGKYKLYKTEGIDNDGDGKINEDGIGGVNLDRNWPAGWTMESRWSENGQYPLSEPETRAIIDFLVEHRNVAMIQSFALPGTLSPAKGKNDPRINAEDLAFIKKLAKKYKELIGKDSKHPYLGGKRRSGGGRFFEWAYIQYGVHSFVSEIWGLPEIKEISTGLSPSSSPKTTAKSKSEKEGKRQSTDTTKVKGKEQPLKEEKSQVVKAKKRQPEKKTDKRGDSIEIRWLRWNDAVLKGRGFVNWKPFKHPKLGDVELGGWKKLIRTNPPAHQLKDIGEKYAKFILYQAAQTPSVSVKEVTLSIIDAAIGISEAVKMVKKDVTLITVGEKKSTEASNKPRIFAEVKAVIKNNGELPTTIKADQRKPVRVEFTFSNNVSLVRGNKIVKLGTISAKGGTKEAKWVIKIIGKSAWVQVKAVSEKGGMDVKRLPIEMEVKP